MSVLWCLLGLHRWRFHGAFCQVVRADHREFWRFWRCARCESYRSRVQEWPL